MTDSSFAFSWAEFVDTSRMNSHEGRHVDAIIVVHSQGNTFNIEQLGQLTV